MAEASAAEGSASAVPAEVVADAAHAVIPAAKHWSRRSVNQKQYRDRVNALRKEVKRRKGLVNGLADPAMELHASRVARLLLRRCSVADTAQIDAGEFPPVVSNDLVQRLWENPLLEDAVAGQAAEIEALAADVEDAAVAAPVADVPKPVAPPKRKPVKVNCRAFDVWHAEEMVKERAKAKKKPGKRLDQKCKEVRRKGRKAKWKLWQEKPVAFKAKYFAQVLAATGRQKDHNNRWRRILPTDHRNGGPVLPRPALGKGGIGLGKVRLTRVLQNVLEGLNAAFPSAKSESGGKVRHVLSQAFRKSGLPRRTANRIMGGGKICKRMWAGGFAQRARRGRKKGDYKISNADLQVIFESHAVPSCKVSHPPPLLGHNTLYHKLAVARARAICEC